jgi:hypothetical protein
MSECMYLVTKLSERKILANERQDAHIFMHLLQSSTCTCFEQYLALPQDVKLY